MVSDNSEQLTQQEIGRMEQELRLMEYDLYEKYCEIGKSILEKIEQESKRVNDLTDQIIETRRKLSEAKQEKCCPECLDANDHGNLYCKRCGAKLPETGNVKENENGTE